MINLEKPKGYTKPKLTTPKLEFISPCSLDECVKKLETLRDFTWEHQYRLRGRYLGQEKLRFTVYRSKWYWRYDDILLRGNVTTQADGNTLIVMRMFPSPITLWISNLFYLAAFVGGIVIFLTEPSPIFLSNDLFRDISSFYICIMALLQIEGNFFVFHSPRSGEIAQDIYEYLGS